MLVIVHLNCFNPTEVRPLFTLSHSGDPLFDSVNRGLTLVRLELCSGHYYKKTTTFYIYFLHKYTCGDPGKNRPLLLVACQLGGLSGETVLIEQAWHDKKPISDKLQAPGL